MEQTKHSREGTPRYGIIHFESGLRLPAEDGRVRQGDCLTDYRAQGIKGAEVRGIEDNGSAMAMATKEAFHVKGTRHVKNLVLHVENTGLYVEAIQRSNEKFSALQLERVPVAVIPLLPLVGDKGRLLMKVRGWGHEFLTRLTGHKKVEKIRQQLSRFQRLRPWQVEAVADKMNPAVKETTPEILTREQQTTRDKLREGLSQPVEEMAKKLRQERDESLKQRPAPPPAKRPKQSPYYVPGPGTRETVLPLIMKISARRRVIIACRSGDHPLIGYGDFFDPSLRE